MFSHLHLHSTYSVLDGLGTSEQICNKMVELEQDSFAVTDHGSMSGIVKTYEEAKKKKLRMIVGVEFYMVDSLEKKENVEGYEARDRNHLVCWAKNKEGYQNLMRLISFSWKEGFYYRPRIDFNILRKHSEGLVASTACSIGKFARLINEGKLKPAAAFLKEMKEIFNNDFFIEVMPLDYDEQKKANEAAKVIAPKLKIPIIATNDCHYPNEGDSKTQEVLLCINTRSKWSDPNRWKFGIDSLWIKSEKEMLQSFQRLHPSWNKKVIQQYLNNTEMVVGMCKGEPLTKMKLLPTFKVPKGFDDKKYLMSIALEGLKKKKLAGKSIYKERFRYELKNIFDKNFSNYFLIVQDIVNWCKSPEVDICVGPARGSAAGSLVSYCLGITMVDPIHYGLMFERFIDPNRTDDPDIDLDFEDNKRHLVKEYIASKYGEDKVATIGTFGTLKGKAAIKDCARVFSAPINETQKVCDLIIERSGGDARASFTIEDTLKEFLEVQKYATKYPMVMKFAKKIEGQIRQVGIHAAGVIISNRKLDEFCPVEKRKGEIVVGFDGDDCSTVGFLKLDILGLRTCTIIKDAVRTIKKIRKKEIILEKIPMDDQKVFKKMSDGECTAIFQFETPHQTRMCRDFGIENFHEMVNINAASRPGCLQSGATELYGKIKRGIKKIKEYGDERIDKFYTDLVKDSRVILFQEQVMRSVREIGGFDWSETNFIRKTMSKSLGEEKFNKYRDKFIKHSVDNGSDEKASYEFYQDICVFGAWGFNKSHSVSYSMLSYWCGWLRENYPIEFFHAVLRNSPSAEKVFETVRFARKNGIIVEFPDVSFSGAGFKIENGKIYGGLKEVKGVGAKAADKIEENQPYKTIEEFFDKNPKRNVNKRVVNSLMKAGAFNSFGVDRRRALESIEKFIKYKGEGYEGEDNLTDEENMVTRGEVLSFPDVISPTELMGDYYNKINGFRDIIKAHDINMSDALYNKSMIGNIGTINLKSKMRGKKVAKGGKEDFEKIKAEENKETLVKYCIMGIGDEEDTRQFVVGEGLLDVVKPWMMDAKNKRQLIGTVFSSRKNSHICSLASMVRLNELKRKIDEEEDLDLAERIFITHIENKNIKVVDMGLKKKLRNVKVVLFSFNEIKTKKGHFMAFLNCGDSKRQYELTCFPRQWEQYQDKLKYGSVITCDIKVEKKGNILESVKKIQSLEKFPIIYDGNIARIGIGTSGEMKPKVKEKKEEEYFHSVDVKYGIKKSNCPTCELKEECENFRIPPDNPVYGGILFVLDVPGIDTDENNIPLDGKCIKFIKVISRKIGIPQEKFSITSVVKCNLPGDRKPTVEEIEKCLINLKIDLVKMRPRLIVPMGDVALKAICGAVGMPKYRGQKMKSIYKIPAVPVFHPMDVLRNMKKTKDICKGMEKAKDVFIADLKKAKNIFARIEK